MFTPKTEKISKIAKMFDFRIQEISGLLAGRVCVYIDYANVKPWAKKLKWSIDVKRLKQFLDSFSNIEKKYFYYGILFGDEKSEKSAKDFEKMGYVFRTKPVKILRLSIKVPNVSLGDPAFLSQFIKNSLLRKYQKETIEYLNGEFQKMNQRGEYYIEDRKCNFDVEIGVDMLMDAENNKADTFVLWSGDSDFHEPVKKLLDSGKKVLIFSTARCVAKELNDLRKQGLIIFDIQKIKEFIARTNNKSFTAKGGR